jgi:hypothetical protein
MNQCPQCHGRFSRISGSALQDALATAPANHPWQQRRPRQSEWFSFCASCDAQELRSVALDLPFLAPDGVMRTLDDAATPPVLSLSVLRFTADALRRAIAHGYSAYPKTGEMEAHGRRYAALANPQPVDALTFCEGVCDWGDDKRGSILRNLRRYHAGDQLQNLLHVWLSQVQHMNTVEALEAGLAIKGLHVSFASKHLRMLEPDRFATLDGVLERGLGFALNPVGYQLFLDHLAELSSQLKKLGETDPLFSTPAQIEIGIFHLTRQRVRAGD